MAKIVPLCSSSKGNSVFIGDSKSGVLVDCGCSFKALKTGLDKNGIPFEAVRAVLVTHEHIDHVKGLFQLTKHTDIPVYASNGTINELTSSEGVAREDNLHTVSELKCAPVDMKIDCFHISHDCAEGLGYTLSLGEHRVAVCTDLGYVSEEVRKSVTGCDAVYLEANYDIDMLRKNPRYPYSLKKRISSEIGHLSNNACGEFCRELVRAGTRRIILGHLSQVNNTSDTAYRFVSGTLERENMRCNCDYTLDIAPVMTEGKYIVL